MSRCIFLVPLLCGFVALKPVYAAPIDSGSLLRDLEKEADKAIKPMSPGLLSLPKPLEDTGQKIVLNTVTFKGYEGMATQAELQKLIQPSIGHSLGFNGLQNLADIVTQYLKNKGFFLAFAYLPEQDITEGKLIIAIQTGRIEGAGQWQEQINAAKNVNLSPERITKTLNSALQNSDDPLLTMPQLERGLLTLNDLSGIKVTSNLEKGEAFGTTKINLAFEETPRYTGMAWIDNYGHLYTGRGRANLLGSINNLSGIGDKLTAMVNASSGLSYGRLSYQMPLGYRGTSLNATVSAMDYLLDTSLVDNHIEGDSFSAELAVKHPFVRSRLTNVYGNVGVAYKRLKDYLNGDETKDRQFQTLDLGLLVDHYDFWLGGGYSTAGVTMTWGDLNRKGNAVDDNFDRQGPRTQGNYAKLMLFASRTQSVSPLLTLVGNLTLQPWVSKNLDANEKVGLTGASGLRAYSSGDISGDLGGLLNLEARYRLSGWTFEGSSAQAVLFYDLAYVQLDHTVWQIPANAAERNSFYASGVGVGLDITKSDAFSLKASYAFKVNDNINDYSTVELDSEGQRSAGRWMLQLLARF